MTTRAAAPRAGAPRTRRDAAGGRAGAWLFVRRWRPLLRMAWRDSWRAKGRTALVLALVGIPILAMAAIDVGYHTYKVSPVVAFARSNGNATAELQWVGAPVSQDPSGTNWGSTGSSPPGNIGGAPSVTQVAARLGGARVIERRTVGFVTVVSTAGLLPVTFSGVELSDPIAAPLASLLSGRLPIGPGEAVITPYVARQTGAHVGGVLRTGMPNRSFRVVGIATSPSKRRDAQAWTVPSAVPSPAGTTPNVDYLAVTRRLVTWAAVQRLNAAGFVVQSRYVDEHPPPPSAVHFQGGPTGTTRAVDAVIALVAGLGMLEIVLLAGPAFAVMGRRLERTLALLAAAGGTRADLRAAVLANAVLLGALAGLGSVLVATVAVRVAEPLLGLMITDRPGPLGVRPSQLPLIAAVGVVTALAAAWMPARAAGRTDVVAALAARRPRDRGAPARADHRGHGRRARRRSRPPRSRRPPQHRAHPRRCGPHGARARRGHPHPAGAGHRRRGPPAARAAPGATRRRP